MKYQIISKKEFLKQGKELLELHKRVIKTYLVQNSLKHSKMKKFFIVYDHFIDERNIREYFFLSAPIFVRALILDRLEDVRNYFIKENQNGKKKKRKS
jgi:hypothetical protein